MSETSISTRRWLAKKAARVAIGGASRVAGLTRNAALPAVRALTYHRFGPCRRMPFTVSAQEFETQMAYLRHTGTAVSLQDLEAHLSGERSLPNGSVLVTIDDGDPSVLTVALPILKKHGVPAVVYALAGVPDGFSLMSMQQVRELHENGIAIGSHSVTHRSLGRIGPMEVAEEVRESKARLEDWISSPVTSFAYPFGTQADFSPAIATILAEAGYATAFTSQHGAIGVGGAGLHPLMLPRIKVESGDPAWLFPSLCSGAMDAWSLIDGNMARLQKPAAVG